MTKIYAYTKDQLLKLKSIPVISSGDVNTDAVSVTLDSNWELGTGITYYINFFNTTPSAGVNVQLTLSEQEYTCTIPATMLSSAKPFHFGLIAKNADGGIIKTSTFCKIIVLPGACPSAAMYTNWENLFKSLRTGVINKLNTKFNTELAATAETADIVSAINGIAEIGDFIDILNDIFEDANDSLLDGDEPMPLLTASMSTATLQETVTDNLEFMARVFGYYSEILNDVFEIDLAIFSESELSSSIDYDCSDDMSNIKQFITTLNQKYTSLKTSIVGQVDDNTITLDSADSDIITALSTIFIDIINALNTRFSQSISISSTSSQVVTAIGNIPTYSQGYNAAKAEDEPNLNEYALVKNIINTMPNLPNIIQTSGGMTELYSVPFLNTTSMSQNGSNCEISSKIQKCGFDLSSAPANWLTSVHSNQDTPFQNATELTDLKLTGCETQTSYRYTFERCSKLKYIELHNFNKNHNVTTVERIFHNCSLLEIVNYSTTETIEALDFTGITTITNAFYNCQSLKNIRFKPNTIQASISFKQSTLLTKESVLSIINGLDSNNVATLTLSVVTKTSCDSWYAKSNGTMYVDCESTDADALSYSDVISAKGWTLA